MTKTDRIKFRDILLVLYLILLIVHFLLKDRFHYLSVIFYACPLPLIISYGLLVTVLFFKRKLLFYTLSTVFLATSIHFYNHYFGSEYEKDSSKPTSNILFWNTAQREPLPIGNLIKHIHLANPKIVALVEAANVSGVDLDSLKSACPDYQFHTLQGDMLIATKGKIDTIIYESETDVYKLNYVTISIQNKPIHIMLVDVYASPLLNKEIPLTIINDAAKKLKVDILMGDFNTPYESVFFKDYHNYFKSFHPYNLGLTSTWPNSFPLIEIDQIWLAKRFQPIKLEKYSYDESDHKLLIAEYQ